MFRIRKIHDDTTPANRESLSQVQTILRMQFPGLSEEDICKLSGQLRDPLKYHFRSILFVAENSKGKVKGFAWLFHAADLKFAYLDYISTGRHETGGGIGSALYERVREECLRLDVIGIFFECLPDDPSLSPDEKMRAQNIARLRFYERYGVFPIINTDYETPLKPGDTDPPYLMFDNLGRGILSCDEARRIVRAILERKYGGVCPKTYISRVVNSLQDDPVKLRAPRYLRKISGNEMPVLPPRRRRIALLINDKHHIHHVQEKGYVEAPARIRVINAALEKTVFFERLPVKHYADTHIKAVHERGFVEFLKRASINVPPGKSVYPYVFPIRNKTRPPRELPLRAGYYCIDTFTPINKNALEAALSAVDCALSAAQALLGGYEQAYALVRPPGHHAESNCFGGFCYFNSAAIAAQFLSRYGKIALLDIDYHHGNGSQEIFYKRADVLTVSIHGHPRHSYPYFSGYEDEKGEGPGRGYNINMPLQEGIGGERYRTELQKALNHIRKYAPRCLVLSLGFDTAKGDPTGSWSLIAQDFEENGRMISSLKIPTLVVQEGGYETQTLGMNARSFFIGLVGAETAKNKRKDAGTKSLIVC
ncbi:MAG: hypothetical protein MRJ65_15615 [Candidatus Brocadiaceae bacterium]|nr:hypothetical protein [Candidatus Brocadiaceae bacterium]